MNPKTLDDGREVIFRFAEKSDAKEILSYLKKVGSETDFLSFGFEGVGSDVQKEEEIITRFARATTSAMIVGTLSDMIISVGTLSANATSRFSHNAEAGISVLKEFWGKGIGAHLMNLILEFARTTKHVKNVHLTVIDENDRAMSLYEKTGFKVVGRYKNFSFVDGKYRDAIIMEKEI